MTGRARMVDVSEKSATYRTARACATVRMARGTMEHIRAGQIGKGDVLAVAQVAGIMATKKNAELIPMCHPLLLTKADITFQAEDEALHIFSEIRCRGETGVEMEALTAGERRGSSRSMTCARPSSATWSSPTSACSTRTAENPEHTR